MITIRILLDGTIEMVDEKESKMILSSEYQQLPLEDLLKIFEYSLSYLEGEEV